jgi:hypothetical protein
LIDFDEVMLEEINASKTDEKMVVRLFLFWVINYGYWWFFDFYKLNMQSIWNVNWYFLVEFFWANLNSDVDYKK